LALQRAAGNAAVKRLVSARPGGRVVQRQGPDVVPPPPQVHLSDPTLGLPGALRPALPSPGPLFAGGAPVGTSTETMAEMGRRLAAAAAERRRRELNALAQVRAARTGRTTVVVEATRTANPTAPGLRLRDVTISAQYGVAIGYDLRQQGPSFGAQGVVDFGLIYHAPPNPDDDNSLDPGGAELHFQVQVNSDSLNRGRVTAQGNLQGTLAAIIAQGVWGNVQAAVYGQLSAGSGYNSANQLGSMFGASGGGQLAATFNLGGAFQLQGSLGAGVGVQGAAGELQVPFQVVAAVGLVFDTHAHELGGGRESRHGDGNPW
jgi:hypothetical protein